MQKRGGQSLIASATMPRVWAWVAAGRNLYQSVEIMGPAFRMTGALLGIGKPGVGEALQRSLRLLVQQVDFD